MRTSTPPVHRHGGATLALGLATVLGLALVLSTTAAAQPRPRAAQEDEEDAPRSEPAARPAPARESHPDRPKPEEKLSVTHHSARIGRVEVRYTATAGTLLLKGEDA